MNVIELINVNKKYNINTHAEVHAVKDLSLKIDKGDLVSIVGPSGSGKSTLLHIMGCIDRITDGEFLFEGRSINKLSEKQIAEIRNKKIGFVLQDFGLILKQNVQDNVSIPLMFSKTKIKGIRKKIEEVLNKLGIIKYISKKTEQLSGGEKQRVAIARALVNEPEIILADEPTGALDQKTSDEIIDILIDLNRNGKTVVIVTHNMEIAGKCSRIIYIEDGRIIKEENSNG